jgi:hypothetical protein
MRLESLSFFKLCSAKAIASADESPDELVWGIMSAMYCKEMFYDGSESIGNIVFTFEGAGGEIDIP